MQQMRKATFIFALLAMLVACFPLAQAQSIVTGELAGVVTDPTGAAVAGASVALKSTANGEAQTATTNNSGEYRFPLLRPGPYTLTVTSKGFQTTSQRVNVALGQSTNIPFQLGVQQQAEVINVTEQVPLLQNDNANLATTFNTQQLENLPAPGGDMTAYAFTAPGVTVSTGGGYGAFSAFGLPSTSNLFTINGNDNMDPYLNLNNSGASNLTLGANEIQEAAVVLNGYTGQYGRQAGAQVNYVTKSGSNAFHGNAAWEYNGRVMNANDWFNNANGQDRPFSVSNEWFDSIGGPIKKNKLFFFFDNEGLRYVLPGGGPVYIPSPNFSSYILNNVTANNPSVASLYQNALGLYSKSSGAGRATPVTLTDDPSGAYGCGDFARAGFGTASTPCAYRFQSAVNSLNTEWLLATKVDWNLGSNDRVYFRYNTDHGIQATGTDAINPAFNANSVQPSYGGQMGYTHTFKAAAVNQLLLSASYYSAIFGPSNLSAALAIFPTTFTFGDGVPFTNLGGTDYSYPQGRKVRQWQLIDDFSLIKGRHSIGVGINVRKNWVSDYSYGPNTSGTVFFGSITDFVNGSLDPTTGSYVSRAYTNIGAVPVSTYSLGSYIQDVVKLRPNLTFTAAIRFDHNSNISCSGCFNELLNPFSQASHDATQPYNAVIKTGLNQAFPNIEPVVFAPRIGMAWNVTPSTVIRGGVGVFSDLYPATVASRFFTNFPAVGSFLTSSGNVSLSGPNSAFANTAASYAALQSGFAGGATVSQLLTNVSGFARPYFNTIANKLYNPKYYEWNFEVQQSLTSRMLLSVNYVGNHGYQEFNQNLFGNAFSTTGFGGLPTARADNRFGEIRELNNQGFSNYDGLVTSLRFRVGSSFQGSFSYTWGHALDVCSNGCLEPFNALTAVSIRNQLSPYGLGVLNYSNADYDVRHSINANYSYTVAPSMFSNGILKRVAGGWTLAGTAFYHSGYPFSVVNSSLRGKTTGLTGAASAVVLADYTGTGYTSCTTPNTACFARSQFLATAAQNDFGNIPRNSFRGPGYVDADVNLKKDIAITERFRFMVGAFFFNVFNHPNFDLPVNNLAAGGFGTILNTVSAPTSAYGSFQGSAVSGRVIQLQTKVTF